MNTKFDIDPYPGKPRILFVGHGSSSHAHSWIEHLLNGEFNVRLFSLPFSDPPPSWKVRTYLTTVNPVDEPDPEWRKSFCPTAGGQVGLQNLSGLLQQNDLQWHELSTSLDYLSSIKLLNRIRVFFSGNWKSIRHRKTPPVWNESHLDPYIVRQLNNLARTNKKRTEKKNAVISANEPANLFQEKGWRKVFNDLEQAFAQLQSPDKVLNLEVWLAEIVRSWKPHVVHTLGLEPAAYIYSKAGKLIDETDRPVWVAQCRGGPDLALNRLLPLHRDRIKRVLEECNFLVADNRQNYQIAMDMGLSEKKVASVGIVPGTGGIDVAMLSRMGAEKPSQRPRLVLWPKAYECPQSKALPVLEALKLAWDRIKPCELYFTAIIQEEIHMWVETLPAEIRRSCHLHNRLERGELLDLMARARVLLAPSLSDGIPNSLYEAMACGAFPIVSPLETISAVVDRANVLFARNMYPQEIADALVEAMSNDALVDQCAGRNLELVREIADREVIGPRLVEFYLSLAQREIVEDQ